MPGLTVAAARDHIAACCLTPTGTDRVGLEVELLAYAAGDRGVRPDTSPLTALRLPGGSRVTIEPGGQVELSGPPCADAAEAVSRMALDLAAVRGTAAVYGIELVATGFDGHRPPERIVRSPRYDAMEAWFDADGPSGRAMMCNTAALQVNVDLTPERWRRAHAVGPALVAAFAGRRRLAAWWGIDRSRTAPCLGDWADYVLDARVMMLDYRPVVGPLTFRQHVEGGHATVEQLDYHLTTLFPPVRPRGWLELRFLDSLPDPWWPVAVAVTVAALEHDIVDVGDLWDEAVAVGLAHPRLAAAAAACFEAAGVDRPSALVR